MLIIRRSAERGRTVTDWLNSHHTFSFGDYQDRNHNGFGVLRILNEDIIRAGSGLAEHSHHDMEIITYILHGTVEHRDSMGTTPMHRGDVHCMCAGIGLSHREFNPSRSEVVRFLQIGILPPRKGMTPGCHHRHFSAADKQGRLLPIATKEGKDGGLPLHQDVAVYASLIAEGQRLQQICQLDRRYWIQIAFGKVEVNGHTLWKGDGAAITGERLLVIEGAEPSEVLLLDLPV